MDLVSIGEFAQRAQLSPKALRLYGELGLVRPARVDAVSGYRYYDLAQLERARLVASLRQIGMPLAEIALIIDLDDIARADRIAQFWSTAEDDHIARHRLADLLVSRLRGTRITMYEVIVRYVPRRQLLGMKRSTSTPADVVALGKDFVSLFKTTEEPRPEGVSSTALLIYHGEVSKDSDGPVEFCRPIPDDCADELAEAFPDLTLRTEAAHREAVVQLGAVQVTPAQWNLVSESIREWAASHGEQPSALGTRVVLSADNTPAPGGRPDTEFAVPLG